MFKPLAAAAAMSIFLGTPLAAEPGPPVAPTEVMVGDSLPYAYFATPEGQGPFPVIIILGGSEGGDFGSRASAPDFLAEGYAILGLPYYSPAYLPKERQLPDLPTAFDSIPLEKLAIARDWLLQREDVKADGIGLYGVSKGAEFVLAGASRIDGFAAVAAIVPSDVVWEGWGPNAKPGEVSSFSWQGEAVPFVPYLGMEEEFAKYAIPGAKVRLRTPQNIAERRAEAGGLETVVLIFPGATHALSGTGVQRTEGEFRYDEPTLEAQQQIWPATLEFFETHLKR